MTEEKEYMTLEEAGAYIGGVSRATIYNYLNDLNIKPVKFKRDRKAYLALADVKRIKEIKEKPWLNT